MRNFRKAVYLLMGFVLVTLVSCASIDESPGYAYTEQEVQLNAGMYYIPAVLVKPKMKIDKKIPVVVMLHGTASQKNEVGDLYQRLAVYLAQRGYASLRFDFAGTGESLADYRLYNLTTAQHDTTTAMNYLVRQGVFDVQRMGLLGFDQGALIAQLIAARDPRVKSLVTWSAVAGNGVAAFKPFFDKYYVEAQRDGYAVVKISPNDEPLKFGLQWFDEIKNNTSLNDMANYKGKLLAIAGTADTVVPAKSSTTLVNAIGRDRASLFLVDGADHRFNVLSKVDESALAEDQSSAELVLKTTTDWFHHQL